MGQASTGVAATRKSGGPRVRWIKRIHNANGEREWKDFGCKVNRDWKLEDLSDVKKLIVSYIHHHHHHQVLDVTYVLPLYLIGCQLK
jgi:hypothetical protein